MFLPYWLENVLRTKLACTFSTSRIPNAVRPWGALCIFTWKRASHHNGAHFCDISISKSGPELRCFCIPATTSLGPLGKIIDPLEGVYNHFPRGGPWDTTFDLRTLKVCSERVLKSFLMTSKEWSTFWNFSVIKKGIKNCTKRKPPIARVPSLLLFILGFDPWSTHNSIHLGHFHTISHTNGVQTQNHGLYGNIFSNIGAWPLVPNSFACCNKDCIRSHPWTQFSNELKSVHCLW